MVVWETQALGRKSDGQLARELGVDQSTVTKARQRRGIAPFQARPAIDWSLVSLGVKSDAEIARGLGVSRETVRRNRVRLGVSKIEIGLGIDWDAQPLGKMTDADLAAQLKVGLPAIKQARIRRGIAGFTQWPDWNRDLLGNVPDSTIARMFNISKAAVGSERKRRGIPRADLLCLTTEGEPANQEEALIDLYWHERGIPHDFQVKIGPYIADWVINGDTVIEYAGFIDHPQFGEEYRVRLEAKTAFYQGRGWKVEILRPSDLDAYSTSTPPRFKDQSCCSGCGRRFGTRGGPRGGKVRRASSFLCDPCWRAK